MALVEPSKVTWEGNKLNIQNCRKSNSYEFELNLRRQARYLENEIDSKLVSYSKMGANATFASAAAPET
jgi:hypothetical protein